MAYPYTAYITADDFRNFSWGHDADLAVIQDPALTQILIDASLEVDAYCQTTFQYRENLLEQHNWPLQEEDKNWYSGEVFLDYHPIRSIESVSIAVSVDGASGGQIALPIPTTPVPSPLVPSTGEGTFPPTSQGMIWVNHSTGEVQPVYIMLKFGVISAYPGLGVKPPRLLISYTSGYDTSGQEGGMDDNYVLPIHPHLIAATRLTAAAMISEVGLVQQGLGGAEMVRNGPLMIRRGTGPLQGPRGGSEYSMPEAAKNHCKQLMGLVM